MTSKILLITLILGLLLSACGPAAGESTPQPVPAASPTAKTDANGGYPPAVNAARQALSGMLNVQVDQIQVTGIESVEWPDSCLGVSLPDEMCAEVITPGYRVLFMYGVAQYEFHTNADGSSIRQAGGPQAASPDSEEVRPLLSWEGTDCSKLTISTGTLYFGRCDAESLSAAPYPNSGLSTRAKGWAETFAPFEAQTPAGKVTFSGFGMTVATEAEQRMMAEWATLQYMVVSSGRAGAAWQMAFGYARSGGIAGFCDNVAVYRDGLVMAENCKGVNASSYLTATELEQLYGWLNSLAPIDYQQTDPATADAMTITLAFAGQGRKEASEDVTRAIVEFASSLMARAAYAEKAPAETWDAQQVLIDFFSALYHGDYILGAKLYGGDTSGLQDWNPDIQDNLPAWLERGCTQNGLQCLLPRSVTYRGPDARGGYQFIVEFNNPDGTLFQQGPCCGDTTSPGITSFQYDVLKNGENWQVMELPPYVP